MKSIFLRLCIILPLVFIPTTILATQYDTEVTGKGDPSIDVEAVQKAVDKGGFVLLKGIFDFGTGGSVIISKDVNIFGETDPQGNPVTRIKGGTNNFYTQMQQQPPQSPGPKVGIENIHFDGAVATAISLPYCNGAEIINNKIENLKIVPAVVFGQEGMFRHQAISLVGLAIQPKGPPKYLPGAITGTIRITDNEINMDNDKPEKTMAQGVFILGTTGANIHILRNNVSNCTRNSIEVLDNYQGADGGGMILVENNKITTAKKGIPLPLPPTPNGIVVGFFMNMSAANDPTKYTKTIVTENKVETKGDNSFGIVALVDHAVITSNSIVLNGGHEAMAISGAGSNTVYSNNSIKGVGSCAFNLKGLPNMTPCRNVVIGNNLDQFKSSMADVLLGGSCNLISQKECTVIDDGQTNLVMK